ncbi:T200B protein, partial [Probosciger aterrimus]|nr:T200B protein [Probosciger aterrimus]
MTAGSAESNGPMWEPEPGGTRTLVPPVPPAPPRRRGHRLRRRKSPTEAPVKGQLRMRSPSGAFVMVGISVVLVGMTIAVVGYWPHRGAGVTGAANITGDMRREVAAARHVPHSEKLKLIGPVIMGIGLFIFICANTMLYENRDMETRRLMQKGLYCMVAALPEGAGPEDGHCQRGDTQPVPKASAECVEGCYRVDLSGQPCPGTKWSNCYGSSGLQTTAEFLQRPAASPAASLLSLRSGASTEANLSLSCHAGADSSSSSIAPRGHDHGGGGGGGGGHIVINVDGGAEPVAVELGPDAQLHTPGHSKSLDLGQPGGLLVAPIKDRKNRSWPRLDHVSLVGYTKLESTGESSDRL